MKRRNFLGLIAAAPLAALGNAKAQSIEINAVDMARIEVMRKELMKRPHSKPLFDMQAWQANQRDVKLSDFFERKCWIGVDMTSIRSVASISLLFEQPDSVLVVFGKWYWPDEVCVEGTPPAYDRIAADVEAFCDVFDVQTIACDPFHAHYTAKRLWDGKLPVMIYPGTVKTMTAPLYDLIDRVATGRLLHDGDWCLNYHFGNVRSARNEGGGIFPVKDRADSNRSISCAYAACMANGVRLGAA